MTTNQASRDIEWNRNQDAASRIIAAQEVAPVAKSSYSIISELFDFSRDEENCREDAYGNKVQMAMRLTLKGCPSHGVTVIHQVVTGGWMITDMSRGMGYNAQIFIEAVQERIERNAIEKGRVN